MTVQIDADVALLEAANLSEHYRHRILILAQESKQLRALVDVLKSENQNLQGRVEEMEAAAAELREQEIA